MPTRPSCRWTKKNNRGRPAKQVPQVAATPMKEWLTDFTTFRLGGACRELATVSDAQAAAAAIQEWNAAGIPWRVMGGGSNLLVADAGIPEAVLRIFSGLPDCRLDDGMVCASASTA